MSEIENQTENVEVKEVEIDIKEEEEKKEDQLIEKKKEEVEKKKDEEIKIEEKKEEVKIEDKKEEKQVKESKIYRAPGMKLDEPLVTEVFPGKKSMAEVFTHICERSPNEIVYLSRRVIKEYVEKDLIKNRNIVTKEFGPIETLTFGELHSMVSGIASGLTKFVPKMEKEETERPKIGIFLETRKEWMIIAQSTWQCNFTLVTCYASLGIEALISIINETEMKVLVVNSAKLKFIDDRLFAKCKSLKKIITVGNDNYVSQNFEQINLYDLMIKGKRNPADLDKAKEDDLSLIMYTSGTTKKAKGVCITHRNLMSAVAGYSMEFSLKDGDTYLSYLPLAHIYELVVHLAGFQFGGKGGGGKICFGNPHTLVAKKGGAKHIGDLEAFKPSVLIGVPRVFETIKVAVYSQLRKISPLKKKIFDFVLKKRINHLKKGENKSSKFDHIIFKKIQKVFGGKVRLIISGGAPLASSTHYFLQAVLGSKCVVCCGYGLSESMSVACVQKTTEFQGTTKVGYCNHCCEIKLVSVPEMGYLTDAENPEGELLIRGANITKGYYKREDLNKEAFTKDGFFRTGDIARVYPDGSFALIDRKKSLIKLQCGEYVSCEQLESYYGGNSEWVLPNGLILHVNPLKNDIIAIVLVNKEVLREFGDMNGKKDKTVRELMYDTQVKAAILGDFKELAKKKELKHFEYIKNIYLTGDIFTTENGLLTPSNKIKRKVVAKKYEEPIADMFDELQNKKRKPKPKEKEVDLPKFFSKLDPSYVSTGKK